MTSDESPRPTLAPVVMALARLILGGTFIYLALLKLESPPLFLKNLAAYDVLPLQPPGLINATAIFMPWAEILVGACLVVGILTRGAAVLAFAMLLVFTVLVGWRGVGMIDEQTGFFAVAFDCGCGTGVVKLWSKLASNSILIALAAYIALARDPGWSLWSLERRRATSAAA